MRHPIRGLLIGPMVVPAAYWIGVMAYALMGDSRLGWWKALRELAVIVAFGLPIAYAAALVWGAPILYALHRLGWLRAAPVIVAGAILGALAGGACWWAGQDRSASPAKAVDG